LLRDSEAPLIARRIHDICRAAAAREHGSLDPATAIAVAARLKTFRRIFHPAFLPR